VRPRLSDLRVYGVLKGDSHFYPLCDADTMFAAKPDAEGGC